ncbi:MAG: MBL fold metallo-hydrolase [Treponema sp.]|nr:MBL fold metallo-hydrolase [Treponema sp.]
MKLYFHYCASGLSNCYLLGGDTAPHKAIIIDPGNMDSALLKLIEDNNFEPEGIFITHDHIDHVNGLKTFLKIYDAKVYAVAPEIGEHGTVRVRDGDKIEIGPFKIEVFTVPGHTSDSVVYKIGRLLFIGDALSASLMGRTVNSFSKTTLINALRKKILSLPGDYTILPGHGPPTTLEAERRFNLDLNSYEQQKDRRPTFKID